MRLAISLLLAIAMGSAVFLGGSATATAPVPKHLAKDGDNTEQSKLQGRWKLESLQVGTMPLPGATKELTLEFRGDTLTAITELTVTAKFKLDVADGLKRLNTSETKKVDKDGKPAGKEDNVSFGYILDGDKLLLAVQLGKMNGQAADPAKPGNDVVLFVLSRIKPEK